MNIKLLALAADLRGLGDAIAVAKSPAGQDWTGVVGLLSKSADALFACAQLAEAAPGVIRVADRATQEFDALRAAIARIDALE